MSISFACEHCGKSFTLDDRFAGKRGRCKGCGETMIIPERTRSVGMTSAVPEDDVYGFNEAPLPPRLPRAATQDDSSRVAIKKKKKKKRAGFFSGSQKNSSASSSGFFSFDISPRLILGVLGAIFAFVILPAMRGTLSGLSTRSEVEAYYRRQIEMVDEISALLRTVNDVNSATAASEKLNEKMRALIKYTRANMNKKLRKTDLDELGRSFKAAQDRSSQTLSSELSRVVNLEGVVEALKIDAVIDEQIALEKEMEEIKERNRKNGIN